MFILSFKDMVPYDRSVLFELVGQYNLSIWPIHIVVFILAIYIIYLVIKARSYASQLILQILGVAWITSGWIFFIQHYASINWIGQYFGYLFILQGLLLFISSFIPSSSFYRLETKRNKQFLVSILILCLLIYPLSGFIDGRSFIQLEVFALTPDATLLVTLIFLFIIKHNIKYLLIPIPVIGSIFSIIFSSGIELYTTYWILAAWILWFFTLLRARYF